MRFFKRRICSGLPTAIEKEVNYTDLMKIRARKQKGAAEKKAENQVMNFKWEMKLKFKIRIEKLGIKWERSKLPEKLMTNRMLPSLFN